jgi:nucleotide-binding universal stress UspA family protein
MSADAPAVPEAHLVVGFDGTPPALRALDAAVRLLTVRPGRITVVWVAHLTASENLSADAVTIVESDFDEVARELRAAVAERLGAHTAEGHTAEGHTAEGHTAQASTVRWDFEWRQGLIAPELIAAAEAIHVAHPDQVVVITVGSSSSAMHRVVGSVAVSLARHAPVPVMIVP